MTVIYASPVRAQLPWYAKTLSDVPARILKASCGISGVQTYARADGADAANAQIYCRNNNT